VQVNNERSRARPGRKAPGRSDGRRAGLAGGCRSKPTAATADLARWWCPAAASREGAVAVRGPLSKTRVGARALEAIARQRAPEARSYGQASPADGRGRSAAAGGRPTQGWLRAAPVHRRVKACTVKSRATRRRDPAARTVPAHRPEPTTERRCRAAPQAPRGGSRRPKGRTMDVTGTSRRTSGSSPTLHRARTIVLATREHQKRTSRDRYLPILRMQCMQGGARVSYCD